MSESYVYKNEVDWSLFNYGLAIPVDYQIIFRQIADRYIERGESKQVTLYLEGKSYQAKINNNKIHPSAGNRKDIVQIRYSPNSDLAHALRGLFSRSFSYISAMKKMQPAGSKAHITLPEDQKEYLAIYTTEYDDSYVLEAITAEDVEDCKTALKDQDEQQIESYFNTDMKDKTAGIYTNPRVVKVRKLNRLIGENLKLLYGYRCQLCGQLIGEEFGSHIAEAHHIDYFVNSLNNDASNQMIVCPNHHRIIHDANPVFDRRQRLYVYENGMSQKLVLNRHL